MPRGAASSWVTESRASSTSTRMRLLRSWNSRPASVRLSLRVVRLSRRTPSSSSSAPMPRATEDGAMPSLARRGREAAALDHLGEQTHAGDRVHGAAAFA